MLTTVASALSEVQACLRRNIFAPSRLRVNPIPAYQPVAIS
jgi:hypothetical protein